MPIEFEGKVPTYQRIPTKLWSFNKALLGGLVVPSIIELYGYTHIGKSSLAYFLAGSVRPEGKIALADLEHFDPEYIKSCIAPTGYQGTIKLLDTSTAEKALTGLKNSLLDEKFQAGILDSVGAIMPKLEVEGDVSLEERIGLRAKLMARAMRASLYALKRNRDACMILVNHLHPLIALGRGSTTTGGVAIHNQSTIRIRLKAEQSDEGVLLSLGHVEKLRWGGRGRWFKVAILPGIGIHPGLTATFECVWRGIAEKDRVVKLDGKSYGYMKKIVDAARSGEEEIFVPFVEALQNHE